jgi:hypothetical protein
MVPGRVLERPDRAAVSEVLHDAGKRFGARLEDLAADQLTELSREIAEQLAPASRIEAKGTEGFLPDHLPFKPVLPALEERRRAPSLGRASDCSSVTCSRASSRRPLFSRLTSDTFSTTHRSPGVNAG